MGSSLIQGKLWGQRSKDWADIQEQTGKAGYNFALQYLEIDSNTQLLDVGCGSGYFCKMATDLDAFVTGIDASTRLLIEAEERVPEANMMLGDMEELPFGDDTFDIVTAFNSFQYAGDTTQAIAEAVRVLKPGGKLVAMVWGNPNDCEAATYLKAVGSLLPASPAGGVSPFALSENSLIESLLTKAGLTISICQDVPSVWDYPDMETAVKGLISAGPVARAIEFSGIDKAYQVIAEAVRPFVKHDGQVIYHNTFRVIIANK